jgi:flagellar hook-associated protein 1
MASLHDSLTIARSAILTHQERMAVISNNIANVNTPGYHKRVAVLGTNPASAPTIAETRRWELGAGVRIIDVVQQYNDLQENLLRTNIPNTSYNETMAGALGDIEALMAGLGDNSLADNLQAFWNAWHDVANNADIPAFRSVLLERAVALTNQISSMSSRLGEMRREICANTPPNTTGVVQDTVDQINSLASRIKELNTHISTQVTSYAPYDLQDTRTDLVRQLSELVEINVTSDFTITVDGQTLVSGDGATINTLAVSSSDTPVSFTLAGNPVTIDSGVLGAWVDVASTIDDPGGSLLLRLDTLADTIFTQVNNLHTSGYDLNGNTGEDFFTGTDTNLDGLIDAGTFAVNDSLYDQSNPLASNPRLVAAAATRFSAGPPPVPNPEDGAIALQIAALASATPAALNSMHFHEFIPDAMASIGARLETAITLAEEGNAIKNTLMDAIQEETGVNLDEELMDMLSAQRAYQAAARLFNTIDGMLETIINRLGV